MEYDSLGRSIGKFPGATKHLKRWSCFFRTEYSKLKFVFHIFKEVQSHLWNRVQAFAVVFGKWNWFVQMVNAIPGRNLPGLNFAYHLWTVARKDKTLPRIQKHFPESKTRPRILGNLFGFWEVFSILRSVFVFWEVCLDSGKCFAVWEVFCPYEPPYGPTGLPV